MIEMKQKTVETYDGSTPLSIMQEMVISNLLKGMSDWDAYKGAGYKAKNPSSGLNQLRKNKKFMTRFAYRRDELQANLRKISSINEAKVLEEIRRLAFSNMADFVEMDENGEIIFKNFAEISRSKMAAVESIKITKTTTHNRDGTREYTTQHTTFKLHPKTANLDQLCKHLGLFKEPDAGSHQTIIFQGMDGKVLVVNAKDKEDTQDQIQALSG